MTGDDLAAAIGECFADLVPPAEDQLLMAGLAQCRPFEARELTRLLLGRDWKSITAREIEEYPDWLVFLSPQAFRYYLPSWLCHALEAPTGYAAQFTLGYLDRLPPEFTAVLGQKQRDVIELWRRAFAIVL